MSWKGEQKRNQTRTAITELARHEDVTDGIGGSGKVTGAFTARVHRLLVLAVFSTCFTSTSRGPAGDIASAPIARIEPLMSSSIQRISIRQNYHFAVSECLPSEGRYRLTVKFSKCHTPLVSRFNRLTFLGVPFVSPPQVPLQLKSLVFLGHRVSVALCTGLAVSLFCRLQRRQFSG